MNINEKNMLNLLSQLTDLGALDAVKAEFEAEGTRTDEFLRLLDIGKRANTKIALKIGGCEALRDIADSKQFGVDYVIGPMIETPYALGKFIDAKNRIYSDIEQQDTKFLFNLETITGFKNLEGLIEIASGNSQAIGVVLGRVDFVGSLGWERDAVNSSKVVDYAKKVAESARNNSLELVIGGGINLESWNPLREILSIHLSRFETRKIVFSSRSLENQKIFEKALSLAGSFELNWLENKMGHYVKLSLEDETRLIMLRKRWG